MSVRLVGGDWKSMVNDRLVGDWESRLSGRCVGGWEWSSDRLVGGWKRVSGEIRK